MMTLDELYELTNLSFLKNDIVNKLGEKNARFKKSMDNLKLIADAMLEAVNNGTYVENDGLKKQYRDAVNNMFFDVPRHVGYNEQYEGYTRDSYDDFLEGVDTARRYANMDPLGEYLRQIEETKKKKEDSLKGIADDRQKSIEKDIDAFARLVYLNSDKLFEQSEKVEDVNLEDDTLKSNLNYKELYKLLNECIDDSISNLTEGENTSVTSLGQDDNLENVTKVMYCKELLERLDNIKDEKDIEVNYDMFGKIAKDAKEISEKLNLEKTRQVVERLKKESDLATKSLNRGTLETIYKDYNGPAIPKELEDINTRTVGLFGKHLDALKDAKVRKNSDEYEKLIKAVTYVNETNQVPKGLALNEIQNYTVKLLVIKNSINEYLSHKANKGVNSNAFKKIVAVEALNKEVSKRLEAVAGQPAFMLGDKKIDFQNIRVTYQQEVDHYKKQFNEPVPRPSNDTADECMSRIIMKAKENGCKDNWIDKLRAVREDFKKMPEIIEKEKEEMYARSRIL